MPVSWGKLIKGHVTLNSLNIELFNPSAKPEERKTYTSRWILGSANYNLSADDLENPEHPLIGEILDWHVNGNAPRAVSKSGKIISHVFAGWKDKAGGLLRNNRLTIDVDLDKQKGNYDSPDPELHPKRLQRVLQIGEVLRKNSIAPMFAWSRLYGIHVWIFYNKDWGNIFDCYQDALSIRQLLYDNGCFPEIGPDFRINSAGAEKVEIRPATSVDTRESADKLRCIGLPDHSCYPRQFFDLETTVIEDVDPYLNEPEIHKRLSPGGDKPKKEKKSKQLTDEELQEIVRHVSKAAKISQPKSKWRTMSIRTHEQNLGKIPEELEEISQIIERLSPCLLNRIVNGPKVTENWNKHVKYQVALQIWAALGARSEEYDRALELQTKVMNFLDGENSPQPREYYVKEINSAFEAVNRGVHISCRDPDKKWMNEHCDPGNCKIYSEIQEISGEEKIMIYPIDDQNPLDVNTDTAVSVFPYGFLVDKDTVDLDKPQTYSNLVINASKNFMTSRSDFMAAVSNQRVTSIDEYDFSPLVDQTNPKTFLTVFYRMMSSHRLPIFGLSDLPFSEWSKSINESKPQYLQEDEHHFPVMLEVRGQHDYVWLAETILSRGMEIARHRLTRRQLKRELNIKEACRYYMKHAFDANPQKKPNWSYARYAVLWQRLMERLALTDKTISHIEGQFKLLRIGKPPEGGASVTNLDDHRSGGIADRVGRK